MAEDTMQATQTEAHADETDWRAMYEAALKESRKWEARSKANAERARAYEALMDGDETPEQRIAALSSKVEALEGAEARRALVAKVAESTGVAASIVASLNGADEASLTEQARAVAAVMPHGAPGAPEAGQFADPSNTGKTNAQRFGELVDAFLGN